MICRWSWYWSVGRAFEMLDGTDCVLGPTADGGYYLVGLRGCTLPIFAGIPWSTETVLDATVERLASVDAGLSLTYLKYPVRRLESEIIRDAVLSVCGLLNSKMYGDPIPVMEDAVGQIVLGKENLDGERKPTKATPLGGEEFRRSVYIQVRRSRTLSMFETFDAPTLSPNCEQRTRHHLRAGGYRRSGGKDRSRGYPC